MNASESTLHFDQIVCTNDDPELGNRTSTQRHTYQVVHLMIPAAWDEQNFPGVLNHFKPSHGWAVVWVLLSVVQLVTVDVVHQVPKSLFQFFLFSYFSTTEQLLSTTTEHWKSVRRTQLRLALPFPEFSCLQIVSSFCALQQTDQPGGNRTHFFLPAMLADQL